MAEKKKEEAVYLPPTSQVDLQDRLDRGFGPTPVDVEADPVLNPEKVHAPYAVEDNDTSGYIGVSPEYMTYADDRQKPLRAEEGPEAEALKLLTEGGAMSKRPDAPKGKQTVGGGSTQELVYSATSGEDFKSELVDREQVHADEVKRQADAERGTTQSPAEAPAPAKATAVTSNRLAK